MIDIMYMIGDSVWREPTKQLFTMHVQQKDKDGKEVTLNVVTAVKEDGMVNVFHKENESIEDANSRIVNSVNECDLRGYNLFAVHTLDEFIKMRSISVNGSEPVPMAKDNDGNLVQPMPFPKSLPDEVVEGAEEKSADTEEAPAEEENKEENGD